LTAKGRVNKKSLSFLIDTGASNTIIDSALAATLELNLKGTSERGGGLGTSDMPIKKIQNLEIEIDGKMIAAEKASVMDLSDVNKSLKREGARVIEGIIGADILTQYKAVINYEKRTLKIKTIANNGYRP
jgi:predicted aspartyl protease